MIIGMTGTRRGLTIQQKYAVKTLFKELYNLKEFHHGDCVGADEQVAAFIKNNYPSVEIIGHPPLKNTLRAYFPSTKNLPLKDYIERNHDIVNYSDLMLGFPGEMHEVLRSGTWATIRYSKKIERPLIIVFPNGDIVRV